MKITGALFVVLFAAIHAHAQYFQFSQYVFTPQRVNPAIVASSDFAEASFISRNQSTGGGFHLNSNLFSASYPLISRNGFRWSGLGLTLMDDRAGQSGLFSTQEASLSYAMNIFLTPASSLSFGARALHSRRNVDMSQLYTGLQYLPDRGFDGGAASGEDLGRLSSSFNTFSAGVYWRAEDKKHTTLATAGLSFFDFNRPDESLLGTPASYVSTLVATASIRTYQKGKISIYPEALVTLSASRISVNAGAVTRYEIQQYKKKPSDHIDFITKYRSHEGLLLGVQFFKSNVGLGLSYDFPAFGQKVSNHGAVEFAITLRQLVTPRNVKKKPVSTAKKQTPTPTRATRPKEEPADSMKTNPAPTLSDKLKAKQDSVRASGYAGEISHEPMVLEKAVLHFNFRFNSTDLDDQARQYLDQVAEALIDNPELALELTGHTDNVGSAKFNVRLSLLRAQALADYLISKGVHESRIKASGKGMAEPLKDNLTEENRALNRRVEMRILYAR